MIVIEEKETNLLQEIENHILEGLKKGYDQNLYFTQNYTDFQSRIIEYLITVNIAQNLEKYCFRKGLSVNLEYPIENFYNGAFPSVKFPEKLFGGNLLNRKDHNPINNKSKRIDIAITEDSMHNSGYLSNQQRSLVGIEVKALNPVLNKIKEDVLRIVNALNLKDPISRNQILSGYICFFRRFDKDNQTLTKSQIEKLKKKEIEKWSKIINEYSLEFTDLNFEIIPKKLKESPVENILPFGDNPAHENHEDYADNSGLVMAYLIKITHNRL